MIGFWGLNVSLEFISTTLSVLQMSVSQLRYAMSIDRGEKFHRLEMGSITLPGSAWEMKLCVTCWLSREGCPPCMHWTWPLCFAWLVAACQLPHSLIRVALIQITWGSHLWLLLWYRTASPACSESPPTRISGAKFWNTWSWNDEIRNGFGCKWISWNAF